MFYAKNAAISFIITYLQITLNIQIYRKNHHKSFLSTFFQSEKFLVREENYSQIFILFLSFLSRQNLRIFQHFATKRNQ
jgi:hypothetical protein